MAMIIAGMRILFMFLAIPAVGWASGSASTFYEKGQYREALAIYERSLASGGPETELLFNAGLCCYRLREYPRAILYFEKALLWKSGCGPCRDMRDRANRAAGIERMEMPGDSTSGTLQRAVSRINSLYAFAIGSLMLSMAIALRLFAKSKQVKHRNGVHWTLVAVALVCMALAFSREWSLKRMKSYILMETVQLHQSPDPLSPAAAELPAGIKLDELLRIGDWVKVTSVSWETGWVPSGKIEKIGL
jgi:tetratricopeptide (TPR) repeat protein